MDVSGGGGDNTVLGIGFKVLSDYYIMGWSSDKATVDDDFIKLIKNKQQEFSLDKILYEKNGASTIYKTFRDYGINGISYHQKENKELKISSIFDKKSNIIFILDAIKENKMCYNSIKEFNPSKSKNDDEVDVLSELIGRLDNQREKKGIKIGFKKSI